MPDPARAAAREVPPQLRMPLLTLITQQSLDEDYRQVADKRSSGADDPTADGADSGPRIRLLAVVAVLAFGLLVAVAAVQTSRDAGTRAEGREVLISRIDDRQKSVASLHRQIAKVTDQNNAADFRVTSLGQRTRKATQQIGALGSAAGFAAVSGDGVRITVDDAPGGQEDTQVRDSDLAAVVNGLWAAGATAVSVNGQRVTALSALRNSGSVIRINDVSLSPPYTVLALGDTRTLQARLVQTTSWQEFHNLVAVPLGMPVTMDNADDLHLPAASPTLMHLSYAHAAATPDSPHQEEQP